MSCQVVDVTKIANMPIYGQNLYIETWLTASGTRLIAKLNMFNRVQRVTFNCVLWNNRARIFPGNKAIRLSVT